MQKKIVLGLHIGHDRGACLIENGVVVGAIAQERLDRIKYSQSFDIPFEAIDGLLEFCNLTISDICCVGFSCDFVEGSSIMEVSRQEFKEDRLRLIF